ncbi:hypothetical protein EDC03_0569 [Pseudokineococcus lusitanus]|uniref:Minor tail protein n=1 Tax=Pseudokineococcus lusitanus TaxID=763993 RepID=A0A3N1HTU2_9ACTN|nr:hypothetical protein EDC03_0569 [Pseudokineococcus lusitanus]
MSHTWVGWDGSVWDLTGDRVPTGVLLQRGARALGAPVVEHHLSRSPALHGARWRGGHVDVREVYWPVKVYAGPGQEWLDYDSAFWRTMRADQPGTWVVTQPSGEQRSLRWRFVDDGGHAVEAPGEAFGQQLYGIRGMAEQPFWEGRSVVVPPLGNPPRRNFFGGGDPALRGYGPPFFIGSGASASRARIDNPGDHDAWPEYVIAGPVTSATVGLGGRLVEVPLVVQAGRALVIDTAPDAQWALEGDLALDESGGPQLDEEGRIVVTDLAVPGGPGDRTRELGSRVEWAPVPPGARVPLQTAIVGTGAVQPSLTPLHNRAW